MLTLGDIKEAAQYVLDMDNLNGYSCNQMESYLKSKGLIEDGTYIEDSKIFSDLIYAFTKVLRLRLKPYQLEESDLYFIFIDRYVTILHVWSDERPTKQEVRKEWLNFIINYKEPL